MHPADTIDAALDLASGGASATEIARQLGIPRSTVRDWVRGKPARVGTRYADAPAAVGEALPYVYIYLLGMYLGDGCLSAAPRGVFKLRVFLDARYPGIVDECTAAMKGFGRRRA